MKSSNSIAIYFSKDEYEKVSSAASQTILKETQMLMVMIKKGLDTMQHQQELVFKFDKVPKDKKVEITKTIRVDPMVYDDLSKIRECTPFTMSNLAKYYIMPQVDEILREGSWNYGL